MTLLSAGLVSSALAAESKPTGKKPVEPPKAVAAPAASQPGAPAAAALIPAKGASKLETAVFAGGCFWCTEAAFEQVAGVVDVESGYCGGTKATANYNQVHLGSTRHAEAIRVTYDPGKITYDQLLDVFFDAHDPTQLNRQGKDDIGRQYRSAVFYATEEQKKEVEAKIADLDAKKIHKRKIVTKLEPLTEFYLAEDYHQNYARRNPFAPYIQTHALPKAMHVRSKHPELIRSDEQPTARP
jgi:methionine-S-sulfoxide reductase